MWILPTSISSVFAQEWPVSNSDYIPQRTEEPKLWATSSGNLSLWPASWRGWKNKPWAQRLFGVGIFENSMQRHFEDWWTGSLQATRVHRIQAQEKEEEPKTQDTFSRIFAKLSKRFNQSSASLKMSPVISQKDSKTYMKAWETWAIRLRQESTQRKKLAYLTGEIDSSFSAAKVAKILKNFKLNTKLLWPTPLARDWKSETKCSRTRKTLSLSRQVLIQPVGESFPDGYIRQYLNPIFVEKLMGFPLGWSIPCGSELTD